MQDATALRSRPLRAEFDWFAFVVMQPDGSRSYYITPRDVCDQCSRIFPKVARTNPDEPHWREISFGTALRVMASATPAHWRSYVIKPLPSGKEPPIDPDQCAAWQRTGSPQRPGVRSKK